MTREQMVAWLILEGWEYHPDSGDTAAHVIQNRRPYDDGFSVCRGRMVVLYEGVGCYTDGTSASLGYVPSFEGASEAEVQEFYSAINDPNQYWGIR